MKNKTIIIISVCLGVILAVLIGVYFFKQHKSTVNNAENIPQENFGDTNNTTANKSQGKTNDTAKQFQNKLETDDFSVNLPNGWAKTSPAIGTSAMAINMNENISDPATRKINFKSYFAVSYDTLQSKSMDEYMQTVKSGLQQAIPDIIFTENKNIEINGKPARALEAELAQKGVNFKILMVAIKGNGDDVWVISFNTTKSNWDGYKEIFYYVANSFNLKL